MTFEEYGNILYPYITNGNELCYEVEVDGNVRSKIQYLPELPDGERWECFGVNIVEDEMFDKSSVVVEVIPSYNFVE